MMPNKANKIKKQNKLMFPARQLILHPPVTRNYRLLKRPISKKKKKVATTNNNMKNNFSNLRNQPKLNLRHCTKVYPH